MVARTALYTRDTLLLLLSLTVVYGSGATAGGTAVWVRRDLNGAADSDTDASQTEVEPLAETFMVSESSGAACLDGSLPRYWLQPATVPADANRWAVHMQGGGWW